jgi:hypothetical protein
MVCAGDGIGLLQRLIDCDPVVTGGRLVGQPGRADDRPVHLALFYELFHLLQQDGITLRVQGRRLVMANTQGRNDGDDPGEMSRVGFRMEHISFDDFQVW